MPVAWVVKIVPIWGNTFWIYSAATAVCHSLTWKTTLLSGQDIGIVETLHHLTGCVGEHQAVVVVAIGMQAVDLKIFPQLAIDTVLISKERMIVDKDGNGLTGNGPTANLHASDPRRQRFDRH